MEEFGPGTDKSLRVLEFRNAKLEISTFPDLETHPDTIRLIHPNELKFFPCRVHKLSISEIIRKLPQQKIPHNTHDIGHWRARTSEHTTTIIHFHLNHFRTLMPRNICTSFTLPFLPFLLYFWLVPAPTSNAIQCYSGNQFSIIECPSLSCIKQTLGLDTVGTRAGSRLVPVSRSRILKIIFH